MNKKRYTKIIYGKYIKIITRAKPSHDFLSNLRSRLYEWNNPIKNKNNYQDFCFKKIYEIFKLVI